MMWQRLAEQGQGSEAIDSHLCRSKGKLDRQVFLAFGKKVQHQGNAWRSCRDFFSRKLSIKEKCGTGEGLEEAFLQKHFPEVGFCAHRYPKCLGSFAYSFKHPLDVFPLNAYAGHISRP